MQFNECAVNDRIAYTDFRIHCRCSVFYISDIRYSLHYDNTQTELISSFSTEKLNLISRDFITRF